MTDYNKLTVANLRQLLKDRGIPSTGLTRKAQIIEKLEEQENASGATEEGAPDAQDEAAEEREDEAAPSQEPVESETNDATVEPTPEAPTDNEATEARPVSETVAPDDTDSSSLPQKITAPEIIPQPAEEIVANTAAAEQESTSETIQRGPEPTGPIEPAHPPKKSSIDTEAMTVETEDKTPSPAPGEKPSIEKPELLPIPEQSVSGSVEVSRLPSEEREADNKKRKRRSHSPELATQDIKAKKPRPSDAAAPEVHLKEDDDTVMEQRQPEDDTQERAEDHTTGSRSSAPILEDKKPPTLETKPPGPDRKEKGDRYKGLFQPSDPTPTTDTVQIDDRPISPALHVATPALYIRDFMRPLRLEPLRTHLVSLASPPSASPDPTILKSLFIDNMKTHALVLFASTTAASRVRASLHGSVWPPEGQRKELWVDFIPENKVESWIAEEEDAIAAEKEARGSGRPIPAKKYEVIYPQSEDGSVEAVFQELGSSAPLNAPRGPRNEYERRFSEKGNAVPALQSNHARQAPQASERAREDQAQSFATLEELFESTTAKPKLYFLPVPESISQRRLDELDAETSRDWSPGDRVRGRGRDRLDQKMRFSFDEDDRLVEVGGDFGPWADDNGGYRGGFRGRGGGFRGGRGGGGWRG